MKPVLLFFALFFYWFSLLGGNAPATTLSNDAACAGGSISTAITVTGFTDVASLSLRIEYNPSLITYAGAINENPNLTGLLVNDVYVSPTMRKIMLVWQDVVPVTLSSGDTIVELLFSYIDGTATLTFNNSSNNGADCEYSDENGDPLTDTPTGSFYFNGQIFPGLPDGGAVSGSKTITYGQSTGTMVLSGYSGNVLTWQRSYNSGSYSDIPATAGLVSYSELPEYTGTWNYRAVVQYETCPPVFSDSAVIEVLMPSGTTRTWTGANTDDWIDPGNWSPGGVPLATDDILVPSGVSRMPKVKNDSLSCHQITVCAAANFTLTTGMTFHVTGIIPAGPPDYVAYWPLDGNFQDVSGNGYHATSTGSIGFVAGKYGLGATNFITGSFITLPNLNLSIASFSAWVFVDSHHLQKFFRSSNSLLCIGEYNGNWDACATSFIPLTLNAWHHLAIVDGQGLYIDGEFVSGPIYKLDPSLNAVTYAGGPPFSEWLHGIIDEIRWYSRALSPVEIQQLAGTLGD